jgi:Flp pilus assembly protein TadG
MSQLHQLGGQARDDRGSGAVELVLVTPVFLLFIMLAIFIGRVNSGYRTTDAAARYAARTIAMARDAAAAIDVAYDQAAMTASVGSAKCRSMDFTHAITDTEVTVTVTCQVDLSEVNILGIPGHWETQATAVEPVDQWREGGDAR